MASSRPDVAKAAGPAADSTRFTVEGVAEGAAVVTVRVDDGAGGPGRPVLSTFDVAVTLPLPDLRPPTGVVASPAGPGRLRVSWTPPTDGEAPGRYQVSYSAAGGEGAQWVVAGTPAEPPYIVSGLADDASYSVRVCSQTADGRPDPPTACATGQGAARSSPPLVEGLEAAFEEPSTVRATWSPLPANWSAVYDVRASPAGDAGDGREEILREGAPSPPAVFRGVLPGDWSLAVRARNDAGAGPWSAAIVVNVPVPARLLVGIDRESVKLPIEPDNQCYPFAEWMRYPGEVVVSLNREAVELDRPVAGLLVVEDRDGRDHRVVAYEGGCRRATEQCFAIGSGETSITLKLRMACGEERVNLGDEFRFVIRDDVNPPGAVMVDAARNNIDVVVGQPVAAMPWWAAGLLALALVAGARRRAARRGGRS